METRKEQFYRTMDWQECSKEYIKHTEFYWVLTNYFTRGRPKRLPVWAWSGWTVEDDPSYKECRAATMLEF